MDSPADSADSNNESPAQRKARLRRERLNAKLKNDGAARLDMITSANGRPAQPPATEESSK